MIAVIVLAAGASARMGTPKALLKFRSATFLQTILDAAYAAGIERRIIVLSEDRSNILSQIDLQDVTVATNRALEEGPIGSIRAGVEAVINHPVDAAIVWPVDQPHVAIATIEALLACFRSRHAAIVVPTHGGRRGHPVLFGRAVFPELLAAPAAEGARAVVRRDPSRVAEVPVPDPAVLEDIDRPEDYAALLRRTDLDVE